MKITSVAPQNGEYVEIEYNENGETFTNSYIRYSPTYWTLDREGDFIFEQIYNCHEEEKLYQQFMSNKKNNTKEDKEATALLAEIRFLMDNIVPLLETYEEEYEEHDMPLKYPTPDTYYITVGKINKLLR